MARKTIAVSDVVDIANRMLAAPGSDPSGRVAIAVLLESILLDTGNYRGFNYQSSQWLPENERDYKSGRMLRDDYDDTRRVYNRDPR